MARKKAMPRGLLEASRHLRQRATPPEDLLWARLRDRQVAGSKFRRQAVIGKFVGDFYCHESRLIVELDGSVHDMPEVADRDISRQTYLEEQGYTVIRFRNDEVERDMNMVLETIRHYVKDPLATDLPSPSGRGAGGEG